MDKYILRVATLDSKKSKQIIEDKKCPERLTLEFKEANVQSISSYATADIIIIDEKIYKNHLEDILKNKSDYSEILLITCQECLIEIKNKESLSDIWLVDDDTMLEYRVISFLNRARDYRDKELTEIQLETLIDSVPDLIWFKDNIGSHIKVNNSFCNTVNKTKDQIKYRGHYYIWDIDMDEYAQGEYVCMETEEIVIEKQGTFLFDEKVKIGDEMRQLKTYKSALVGRNGETIGTVGLARDVTDIWNTHAEFRTLIDTLPFPMMIVDDTFEFIDANSPFYKLFHLKEENFKQLSFKQFGQNIFSEDISLEEYQHTSIEREIILDDQRKTFVIEKSPIHDVFDVLTGYFYIFKDITVQREYEEKLRLLSETDELTKMSNRKVIRTFFEVNFNTMIKENSSLCICMMDIDFFKQYNDHYGHVEGDAILIEVAKSLLEIEREKGIQTARYGGEEFILIAKNKTLDEMISYVNLLQEKIATKKLKHEKSSVSNFITLSAGLAYYNKLYQDSNISDLIEKADQALYEAKNTGRNKYILKEYN